MRNLPKSDFFAIIVSNMSENQKRKSRTYARNRTRLNRRGFEKNPERDSVFLLKLFLCVLAGSFWIKFSGVLQIAGVFLAGLPFGAILAIFLISKFEKRSENRKIFYAVILICAILSYFLPVGIVV